MRATWNRVRQTAIAACMTCLALLPVACDYEDDKSVLGPDTVQNFLHLATAEGKLELPANGFSKLTLQASLISDHLTGNPNQVIVFTATRGELVGKANDDGAVEVTVDGTGVAKLQIKADDSVRSERQPVTTQVRAWLKNRDDVFRTLEIEFTVPVATDVLKNFSLPADDTAHGAPAGNIEVTLPDSIPESLRTVKVTVTAGSLGGSGKNSIEVVLGPDTVARVEMVNPTQPGEVRVRAEAAGFVVEQAAMLDTAFASGITLEPSVISVQRKPEASLTLTATLTRAVGKVFPGAEVRFTAIDKDSNPVGVIFGETRSDASGVATAKFSPGVTEYEGLVRFRATIPNRMTADATDVISDSTVAWIVKPAS